MAYKYSHLYVVIFFSFFAFTLSIQNKNLNPHGLLSCNYPSTPEACTEETKLSLSLNFIPNILNFVFKYLEAAQEEARKLNDLLQSVGISGIIEKQKGTLQDCQELHQITVSSLQKANSIIKAGDPSKLADAKIHLSSAITNRATCLEGLQTASGSSKPAIISSLDNIFGSVTSSLSKLPPIPIIRHRRRLLDFPTWITSKDRRILESYDPEQADDSGVIKVAKDGSGNFTTISDAISFAPGNSFDRVFIYVKAGTYEENVIIPKSKTNIVLLGDGKDVTIITGSRSVGDGWTTFRSATLAVSGDGFLARGLWIENTAGPEKHQAVALRVNADFVAMYQCAISGYQDTIYVHSFRQFYRECDIYGTVDFIFGNAAAMFQGCNVVALLPMAGQFVAVTAQSRESPDETTGIAFQNCSILASEELYNSSGSVSSYLGRPWKEYSRTVVMESYIDSFIDPRGWTPWTAEQSVVNLYYGEFDNTGPGSDTAHRVDWPGFHLMGYDDAYNFTVPNFITSDEWLDSTSFPYQDGI